MAHPAFQTLMAVRCARPPSLGAAGLEVIETQLLQAGDADEKSVSIDAEPVHDRLRLEKLGVVVAMGIEPLQVGIEAVLRAGQLRVDEAVAVEIVCEDLNFSEELGTPSCFISSGMCSRPITSSSHMM